MDMIQLGDVTLHYRIEGDADGAPIVFANSLGTDFRLWEQIVAYLPAGLRILRFDKRGHGLSSCPPGEYRIDELVQDTVRLIEALDFRDCLFVGLSIGGLIAQGLAAEHRGLLRAMVISNTAARIGTPQMWQERIELLRKGGIEALAENIMQRWFSAEFRRNRGLELLAWRNMLTRTSLDGYIGCSAAVAGADFSSSCAAMGLPVLAIAGSEDGSTPPDVVRATADLIPGSRFELIDNAGHLPCAEQPAEYARILNDFIRECGHV